MFSCVTGNNVFLKNLKRYEILFYYSVLFYGS